MNWFRSAGLGAVLLMFAACGGAPDPVAAPEPEPEPEAIAAEPVQPEPELSLEDRWRSPFAVVSRGRPAARPHRPPVVQSPSSPAASPPRRSAQDTVAPEPEPANPADVAPGSTPVEEGSSTTEGAAAGLRLAEGGLRTHRVEWGETWFGLARRYGVRSDALAALNPGVDPERLRAGEVLLIPAPDAAGDTAARTHTVVAGDSLWGISRRYGVSIERLQEVNRLSDHRVRIGQVLIIP